MLMYGAETWTTKHKSKKKSDEYEICKKHLTENTETEIEMRHQQEIGS
jgi:hypothetical protein